MASRAKQWLVAHPVRGAFVLAAVWYSILLPVAALAGIVLAVAAATVPVLATVAALRWWRETGLRPRTPGIRWLLAVAPLAAVATVLAAPGPVGAALALGVGVEVAARGLGEYVLRRRGTWRSTMWLAPLYGLADLLLGPSLPRLLVGIALGCCLMGLRWRLNTIWPLAAVHAVALLGAPPPWWPLLAAGLAGYGVLLLRAVPTVWMGDRPTVRVLCLDERNRVLLLRWRDPFDGTSLWDMPGGGIDPGETPLAAARRELREETGLPGDCVLDRQVGVLRDSYWGSRRFRGWEPFFLARTDRPDQVDGAGREPFEVEYMTGHCWVDLAAATGLPGRVQPIDLPGIAERLRHEDLHRVR